MPRTALDVAPKAKRWRPPPSQSGRCWGRRRGPGPPPPGRRRAPPGPATGWASVPLRPRGSPGTRCAARARGAGV